MPDWDDETFVADLTSGDVSQLARDKPYLIILNGPNVGELYALEQERSILGRSRSADVSILDESVSRNHAVITVNKDLVKVQDLESRNGTFVNGVKTNTCELSDGDKVQLGNNVILKFSFGDHLDEQFQRQMFDSSLRDALTNIYNKRYFMERIESEVRFADRHRTSLSLLLLDLDFFKRINDDHGHLAGDHVLREFAAAICEQIRNEDVFARYGGEEFAILTRAIHLLNAERFAQRLRKCVESLDIVFEGKKIPLTVSIGLAAMPELKASQPEHLLEAADRALYWAKGRGRNCVAVYSEDVGDDDTRDG